MLISSEIQDVINSLEGIVYAVDCDGVILAVSEPAWSDFAVANNGGAIADTANIIERNMFDFIAGEEVKKSYRERMNELAEGPGNERITFAYRCDSPTKRRDMRMAISPLNIDKKMLGFLFHSIVWAEAARPAMGLYDFAGLMVRLAEERDLPTLSMCSHCQKVLFSPSDDSAGEWVDAVEYYRLGGNEDVSISHGICSQCKKTHWYGH
ncbi:MAG: hypothetical protein ABJ388_00290 [Alphaproteobacteria bacterium]